MGGQISPKFIPRIFKYITFSSGERRLQVEVRGLDFGQAVELQEALKGITGVTDVQQVEFVEGLLKLEVSVSMSAAKDVTPYLAGQMVTHPTLKPFKISIKTVSGTAIAGEVKP
jgi:hypothetical protein